MHERSLRAPARLHDGEVQPPPVPRSRRLRLTRLPHLRSIPLHLEALARVAAARCALWFRPAARVLERTELLAMQVSPGTRPDPGDVRRVGLAIDRASLLIPSATCLPRALAARVMLARRGFPQSAVRIGVARSPEGAFEAHAWTEVDGVTVVGDNGRTYNVLPDHRSALASLAGRSERDRRSA